MRYSISTYLVLFFAIGLNWSCSRSFQTITSFSSGQLAKKGETRINGQIASDLQNTGVHTSIAASPVNHLGLQASYNWSGGGRDSELSTRAWKRNRELAAGTYWFLGNAVLFDLYSGYGWNDTFSGFARDREKFYQTESAYFFVQPGLTGRLGFFDFSVALRFSNLRYSLVARKLPIPLSDAAFTDMIIADNSYNLTEFSTNIKIGPRQSQFVIGFAFSNAPQPRLENRARGLFFTGISIDPVSIFRKKEFGPQPNEW